VPRKETLVEVDAVTVAPAVLYDPVVAVTPVTTIVEPTRKVKLGVLA
jgi:hypothetical protein